MVGGHGWGGASRTGFQPPRVGFREPYSSLSKEGTFLGAPSTYVALSLTRCGQSLQ
jgi:hypothetical protein